MSLLLYFGVEGLVCVVYCVCCVSSKCEYLGGIVNGHIKAEKGNSDTFAKLYMKWLIFMCMQACLLVDRWETQVEHK